MASHEPNSEVVWNSLLAAARKGDESAIGEVCRRLRDYLLLTAEHRVGRDIQSKVAASDIVQQSLLEAQRDFTFFRGSSEAEVRAWLDRILEHNLIDVTRRFRKTRQRDTSREILLGTTKNWQELAAPHKSASSILCRSEADEELLRAVMQLPERRQRVVELRHREGLTYAEIGKAMDISEVAARKLWSRAIDELRSKLAGRHE